MRPKAALNPLAESGTVPKTLPVAILGGFAATQATCLLQRLRVPGKLEGLPSHLRRT